MADYSRICNSKGIFIHIAKTGGRSIKAALASETSVYGGHIHILDMLDRGIKNPNCFYFTFVRNPWDRAVSRYFWTKKEGIKARATHYENTTFKEYIINEDNKFKIQLAHTMKLLSPTLCSIYSRKSPFEEQVDWITNKNGKLLVDFVGRFENIQEDFDHICREIKIPQRKLSHENKSNHKPYWEYYDDETITIIAERYRHDIYHFGYRFGA